MRGSESQASAWSRIQFVLDPVHLRIRERAHVTSLGEILPHQPVGVLVGPPVPGMVRQREEERSLQAFRDLSMKSELLSSVRCNRKTWIGTSDWRCLGKHHSIRSSGALPFSSTVAL